MNELQIRLTADIAQLQSALTKAKNTIKNFESETNKESEQGNIGFRRKIGLIEQLTNKAKTLRTALSQATNEKQIESYNQELERTTVELTRLNALGRSVTANLGSTAGGFNQVANSGANANGIAQEFNRIIQDAPFGLIGIGNNLQQLAGNFSNVAKTAGGTGAAIKASLASIISPVNLGLLAVSALTAGFTAYQLGAFDSLFANEKLAKSFEELASETQSATANASVETTKLNILRRTIEDETISRDRRLEAVNRLQDAYPTIFGNADKEKLLNGQLITSYELLTKAIVQRAEASIAEQELPALVRQKELVDAELTAKRALLQTELDLLDTRNKLTPISQSFSGSDFEQAQRRIKDLQQEVFGLDNTAKGLQINIDGFTESIVSYSEQFENLLEPVNTQLDDSVPKIKRVKDEIEELTRFLEIARLERRGAFFEGVEAPITAESGRATTQGIIIPQDVQSSVEDNLTRQIDLVGELSGAYAGLGSIIGKAFGNTQFGSFLGQFIPFAAKLIATNFKVGTSAAIAKGAQDSIFGGPFSTGAFIAAAVGLVASAFASIGGGKGAGVTSAASASAGAPPQIFTNSQIPRPPSSASPSPSGNIDFDRAQGRLEARVDGNDIVFIYDRTKERQQAGG